MAMAEEDRHSRRLAWCVAHLLRHAPDPVTTDLTGRLDDTTRKYLLRDEYLPASLVTLVLRHGSDEDRRTVARNPRVFGRPLPGLPGPARYADRPAPGPELLAALGVGPGPLDTDELIGLLRAHGARPRLPLTLLRLPHTLDPALLRARHARDPLPPGAIEALLLVGDLPLDVSVALLAGTPGETYGRRWYRPAVRAVRMGLLTCDELVSRVTPAGRTLLLADLSAGPGGLRWNVPEQAEVRSAVRRVLRPTLGDDPRWWPILSRRAVGFGGTLPELVEVVAARETPPAGVHTGPEPVGGVERELALVSLAVPMEQVSEDIRWVRDCLDRGLLTGADVIRHKVPACWALDEDHWLGDIDHPDRHDRPEAVHAARAEADRLFAEALGADADAWWRAARALPDFAGTLPELLAGVIQGDSVSNRT